MDINRGALVAQATDGQYKLGSCEDWEPRGLVSQTGRPDDEIMLGVPKEDDRGHFAGLGRLWAAAFAGRRKAATLAAAALALGVGYHVVFGANGLTVYMQKRAETRALRQQMVELERENDELKGHVDRLKTDPDAIEHQAREELHYAKPGEVIYTVPEK